MREMLPLRQSTAHRIYLNEPYIEMFDDSGVSADAVITIESDEVTLE
jgi:hypothetical protein